MRQPIVSYAQNAEDVLLHRVFDDRRDGFYVDVGAGDPVYLSVTKWFYDLGWNGINVEPHKALHRSLVAERLRDINVAAGAGAVSGEARFYETAVAELSSFDERVHRTEPGPDSAGESYLVPVLPLNEILGRHAEGRRIDFLKVDAEGWERQVLEGLDLQRYRPTIIVMESTVPRTRTECHLEWENMLISAEFFLVHFDGLNRFYVAQEHGDLKHHFLLPPGAFDRFRPAELVTAQAEVDRLTAALAAKQSELDEEVSSTHAQLQTMQAMLEAKDGELQAMQAAVEAKHAELQVAAADVSILHERLKDMQHARAALLHWHNQLEVVTSPGQRTEPVTSDEQAVQVIRTAIGVLRSRKAVLRHFAALNLARTFASR